MKIIDRYILKHYLGSFIFIVIMASSLAVVIDTSEKIDEFLRDDGPAFKEVIFDYFLCFIPFINGLIFPINNLIAVVFITSRLAGNTEFVGMLGNGVSFFRIVRPYLIGALIIAGVHFTANHFLIPISNKSRTAFENKYIYRHNFESSSNNIHVALSKTEEIFISDFNRHDSTGMHFSLIRHDSTGLERTAVLNARRIKLIEKPDKWQLSGIRWREHVDTLRDAFEVYLPHQKIDTSFGLLISDLVVRNNVKDEMTTIELNQYIDRERLKGTGGFVKFEVEKHRRSADAFSIIILTLIGFSISSRKLRGGMAWNLVLGVALSALYILMGKFSMTFSISGGLSPFLGAWVPNIIFTIVAVFMVFRAQK